MSRFDIADEDQAYDQPPELKLWRSALVSYLNDVLHWHKHKKPISGDSDCCTVGAYADFHGNRYQLNRLCEFAQLDVEYVRQKVLAYLMC